MARGFVCVTHGRIENEKSKIGHDPQSPRLCRWTNTESAKTNPPDQKCLKMSRIFFCGEIGVCHKLQGHRQLQENVNVPFPKSGTLPHLAGGASRKWKNEPRCSELFRDVPKHWKMPNEPKVRGQLLREFNEEKKLRTLNFCRAFGSWAGRIMPLAARQEFAAG